MVATLFLAGLDYTYIVIGLIVGTAIGVFIARAAIAKLAHNTFWGGYSGYFKDTDARPHDPTIARSSKPADDHHLYAWASRY